jgi:U3 small nucleolar RNA-associated protein 13
VFTSSLSLRIYELPRSTEQPQNTTTNTDSKTKNIPKNKNRIPPIRVVSRAHEAPVHICVADPTSTYLASGSADGTVKVWHILRGYVTHVFKGHGGVVSALAFSYPRNGDARQDAGDVTAGAGAHQEEEEKRTMRLVTASVDTRIRVFNLTEGASTSSGGGGKAEAVLEGHVSVPRGLDVSEDGRWLVSGGRDSVVLIWDLQGKATEKEKSKTKKGKGRVGLTPTLVRTIPILERVEAVGLIAPTPDEDEETRTPVERVGDLRFFTGGEKGVIKVWDGTGEVVQQFGQEHAGAASEELEEQRQIMNVMSVLFSYFHYYLSLF